MYTFDYRDSSPLVTAFTVLDDISTMSFYEINVFFADLKT